MKQIIRLTESDLHNIIENSVKRIIKEGWTGHGYVPSDGNSMVGGHYGASESSIEKDVLDDLLNELPDIPYEEWEDFKDYCEQNPNIFNIRCIISSSYDESTGYGSASHPVIEVESISGDKEAFEYVSQYPNQKVAQLARETLEGILDNLSGEDFDL